MAKKEFRLPRTNEVAVYEVKVVGYGTVIVEAAEAHRVGTVERLLEQRGVNIGLVDGCMASTRTREYLDNLPAYSGKR